VNLVTVNFTARGMLTTGACMQALAGPYKGEDVRDQLEERIGEHASWVEANTSAQLAAYSDFVASRTRDRANDGFAAAAAAVATSASTATAELANGNGNRTSAGDGTQPGDAGNSGVQLAGGSSSSSGSGSGSKPQSLVLLDEVDVADLTADLESRVKNVVRIARFSRCTM
jgi:hypothetical protein